MILSNELDLMDWKSIERNAKASIDEHRVSITISEILLFHAQENIMSLGGKTIDQEASEIRQNTIDSLNNDVI